MPVPLQVIRQALQLAETAADFRARMKALAFPEPPLTPPALPQLALWSVDADGLPPRPWRLDPDDVFDCITLGCKGMPARTCVVRQQVTDKQRTEQASRGQGTDYPHCDSSKCVQGRCIREAVEPLLGKRWRRVGIGNRFTLRGDSVEGSNP